MLTSHCLCLILLSVSLPVYIPPGLSSLFPVLKVLQKELTWMPVPVLQRLNRSSTLANDQKNPLRIRRINTSAELQLSVSQPTDFRKPTLARGLLFKSDHSARREQARAECVFFRITTAHALRNTQRNICAMLKQKLV